jgi:hypothetical protein
MRLLADRYGAVERATSLRKWAQSPPGTPDRRVAPKAEAIGDGGEISPPDSAEVGNSIEVDVLAHDLQIELSGECSDPDVVFRNRSTLRSQFLPDNGVDICRRAIWEEDDRFGFELAEERLQSLRSRQAKQAELVFSDDG